jgi:uncharacterized membrane protein
MAFTDRRRRVNSVRGETVAWPPPRSSKEAQGAIMNWYEIFLFCHIACAITWLGSGLLMQVQSARAARSPDANAVLYALRDSGALALLIFVPASLGAVIFGVLLVIVGGWGFETAWVALGLTGFLASFLIGNFILKPGAARVAELAKRDGASSPELLAVGRRQMLVGRVELVILYSIVADMVLKPSFDDVAKLALIAGALVIGIAAVLFFSRRPGSGAGRLAHAG